MERLSKISVARLAPRSDLVCTGSHTGRIRVWVRTRPRPERALLGHTAAVLSLAAAGPPPPARPGPARPGPGPPASRPSPGEEHFEYCEYGIVTGI